MSCRPSVLSLRARPTQKSYRSAVADIIRKLKAEHRLSNTDLADRIGCSHQTIANAESEDTDIKAVTLLAMEHEFGAGTIDEALVLAGSRAVPMVNAEDVIEICPLAPTLAFAHKLAEATAPNSPGGAEIVESEMLGMEREAEAASRALNGFVARIKRVRLGFRKIMGRAA